MDPLEGWAKPTERFSEKGLEIHKIKFVSYTGCNRRNRPDFGRVFLRSYYTDITENTYIQSSMVTDILAREV